MKFFDTRFEAFFCNLLINKKKKLKGYHIQEDIKKRRKTEKRNEFEKIANNA